MSAAGLRPCFPEARGNPRLTRPGGVRHVSAVLLRSFSLICALAQLLLTIHTAAADAPPAGEILIKDALVVRSVTRPGRSAIHIDPIEARIVNGTWTWPKTGDTVDAGSREQKWEAISASEPGTLKGSTVRGGCVFWEVPSDRDRVMLLEAAGYNCVYVNGEIRGGDSYGFGYLRLPVLLREGTNTFLFQAGRGDLRVKLIASPAPLSFHVADKTLPDVIVGETEPIWGAVVLLNATTNWMRATLRALDRATASPQAVRIPPLGMFKTPFQFKPPQPKQTNSCSITLEAVAGAGPNKSIARAQLDLRVRRPDQVYVRTFRSEIDGSVQYYAVNPPPPGSHPGKNAALFLSLHGAGVEARGQAEAYSPKAWGPIVCPTNRRPYGFDWEEWGRWDALEVLRAAKASCQPDPQRIYLTGHSMGGHGTWQLGVLFPDQFAAVGPSAGWISFTSYANRNAPRATNAVLRMLSRAAAASDTLIMATNLLQEGVYILHGDADDNVPVSEAREMRKVLGGFHHDVDFHEQPGAGHWWDASDEPGAECVDWAPMFDFFARHIIPSDDSVRQVRFVTVNPAVSARSHWVSVLGQERPLEPSAVDLRCDPGKRRVTGVTTNISRLWIEFPTIPSGSAVTVELDAQMLEATLPPARKDLTAKGSATPAPGLCFSRQAGSWRVAEYPSPSLKGPLRSGPFREAFRNHMALVYGTKGTPEENAWTLAKARYDAETFYYRGNASIELMADFEALALDAAPKRERRGSDRPRNLILYGNAECNEAWADLLGRSPVQVHRGLLKMGEREFKGDDVGCLFLQPHPRDAQALVGAIGGTGIAGLRVTERMPYFVSGAGFPDCLIISADLPAAGVNGIRAAGFFGDDWQVASGEFAWKEQE